MNSLLRVSAIVTMAAAQLGLAACSVQVEKDEGNHKANVDITTLGGGVSVKGGIDRPDTGLAVYPGATPSRSDDDGKEAADVNVSVPFVNVHVVAAKYDSDEAPEKIVAFYRNEMKKFGAIIECNGNIDFAGGRMVCRHGLASSSEIQLGVGSEHRHHIVAVKPRGDRTELSLVYIDKRGAT